MTIETERLILAALTPEQLELLIYNTRQLEQELHCSYQAEKIEGVLKEILEGQLEKSKADRENYLWHSFWLIIRKSDDAAVGMIDFKDVPNEKGEVEIGYGLGPGFEHCGYMTEAVQAFCNWAKSQELVTAVIAETEPDNLASERILLRCGFAEYARNETVWWRLS